MEFPEDASAVVDKFEPKFTVEVTFDGVPCVQSAEMTPTQCQHVPVIRFAGSEEGKLYTIILSDRDAPSVADPKFAEWQHWVVVNVPSNGSVAGAEQKEGGAAAADADADAEAGPLTLTAYFGSAPGKDTGKHRYVLAVYEQGAAATAGSGAAAAAGEGEGAGAGAVVVVPAVAGAGGRIAPTEERVSATSGFPPRRSFNSRAFAARYGLKPVAVLTYLAEWDELVPELGKKLQGLA